MIKGMPDIFVELKKDAWNKMKAPDFKDIVDFYQHYGLCGEEENAILFTMSFGSGTSVGVVSLSGSGKSVLANIFFDYLYPKDLLYVAGRGSKTAIISDFANINKCKGMYIEELQKVVCNDDDKEMLKNILENKPYERKVRDQTVRETVSQKINPLPIAFTIAIENEHKDYNEAEFSRRPFLTLSTDISPETTQKVLQYKLKHKFKSERLKKVEPTKSAQIKEHLRNLLTLGNYKCENPFADYFDEILDPAYLRMRSLLDVYLNVMESSCKWFMNNRIRINEHYIDEKDKEYDGKVFITLQDIINGHELYAKQFHRSVLQVPMLGKKILSIFDKAKGATKTEGQRALIQYEDSSELTKKMMTVDMLHRELKKEKTILNHAVIRQTCEILCEGNYLEIEKISGKTFYLKTFDVEEFEDSMNYKRCWEIGCKLMKEFYPEKYDEWYNNQLDEDGYVKLYHPVTGNKIVIEELKIEKESKDVKEEIETPTAESIEISEEGLIKEINAGNNSDIYLLETFGDDIINTMQSRGEIYKEKDKWLEMK